MSKIQDAGSSKSVSTGVSSSEASGIDLYKADFYLCLHIVIPLYEFISSFPISEKTLVLLH